LLNKLSRIDALENLLLSFLSVLIKKVLHIFFQVIK